MSRFKYDPNIDRYMFDVKEGRQKANKEIKQLMDYLEDKLSSPDVVIDHDIIQKAIDLSERYFFPLFPWQKFFYAFVFGVRYKDGTLMFNEYLLLMGRGSGKNGLLAAIIFCCIYLLDIKNYDITLVATTEEQAKTSFNQVWELLESDPKKFRQHFKWTKEEIICRRTRSRIKFSTSNPKSADGGRPGAVAFDEVHAYEDEEQLKVHTSGLGKRKDPRRFYLTTDGNVRDGFIDQMKIEGQMILAGERPKRRTLVMMYKIDAVEEYKDPDNWVKAVPSIEYLPTLKQEMMDEFEKLEDRPGSRLEFLTKRMNIPAQDETQAVTSWENIKATNQPIPDLRGTEAIGGVDYSDTEDFTGVGLLIKHGGKTYWLHHTFINYKSLERYSYKVPIDQAEAGGFVTIVREETNRPDIIAGWFVEQAKRYNIKMIAADMYRISYLSEAFEDMGLPKLKVARSGSKTHTMLRPIVDDLFAYKKLVFGDDLMMRWYTNNTYVKTDGKGNITYEKIEPVRRKTDGFFAFLHALQFSGEIKEQINDYKPARLKTYTY